MISWKRIEADVTDTVEKVLLEKLIIAEVVNPNVRYCVH
jgi:hypothetical protein